jgi:uncharacterized protein (DUF58 family)
VNATNAVRRRLRLATPLPLIAWAGLCFMQIISPDRAWSWPLAGLGALILLSFFYALSLRDQVTAERLTSGHWVVAGDRLTERFTVTNAGPLPVLWARVRDYSDVPGYCVDRVETVDPHSNRLWTTAGVCQRRGVFRLGPWRLELSDPAGFFRVELEYPELTTIMVYPRASRLPPIELPRGQALGRAVSSDRSSTESMLATSARPYVPGDALRRIHWRTTARQGALMVREFDREPSGDLWLILDLDEGVQAGSEAEATQEYAVILAASLAARFLSQGERRAVGLVCSGRRPCLLSPGRGSPQLWRILEALAAAEPSPEVTLAGLLRRTGQALGSGRTLVILTPSQNPDWIASLMPLVARGNSPTAVLLDATSFRPARGDADTLTVLRALLAGQRIPSSVVAQGFPLQPVERIRRVRRELRALSGTGRVIAVQVEEEV